MNSYLLIFENEDFSVKDKLISCISPIRQEKMNRYLFDSDKKLSLFSELTLRMGLSNMLGCSLIIFALKAIKTESHLLQMNPISILTYLIQKTPYYAVSQLSQTSVLILSKYKV